MTRPVGSFETRQPIILSRSVGFHRLVAEPRGNGRFFMGCSCGWWELRGRGMGRQTRKFPGGSPGLPSRDAISVWVQHTGEILNVAG